MGRPLAFSTDEVVKLYRTGKSLRDVADLVGASMEGVRGRLITAGEPIRTNAVAGGNFPWPDEAVADLKRLHGEGFSAAQIAREINRIHSADVTRNSVIGKGLRLGLIRSKSSANTAAKINSRSVVIRRPSSAPTVKPSAANPGVAASRAAAPPRKPVGIAGNGATFETAPDTPMPKLRIVAATGEPSRIVDAGFGGCRWPLNDPGRGRMDQTLFCCGPREPGQTYCAAHQPLTTTGQSYPNGKKVQSGKELARSLRRFM